MTSNKAMLQRRRFQFSLRTLLVVVLLVAVACSLVKWFGPIYFLRVVGLALFNCPCGELLVPVVFAIVCSAGTWAFARRFDFCPRMSVVWLLLGVFLFLNVAACGYLVWAHDRVTQHLLEISNSSASWLYPDRALMELDAYLEARNPAPPGTIRIHGMWDYIRFTLDEAIFLLSGSLGAGIGPLLASFPGKTSRMRIPETGEFARHRAFSRPTRWAIGLAVALTLGCILLIMELARRQWEAEAHWAAAGAHAEYRGGRLVGLEFNVTTLSIHSYETDQLDDAYLSTLRELTNLEDLGLANSPVTDEGLKELASLTKLKWLELDGTCITDAGLVHLMKFNRLERLDLSRTRVTEPWTTNFRGIPQSENTHTYEYQDQRCKHHLPE